MGTNSGNGGASSTTGYANNRGRAPTSSRSCGRIDADIAITTSDEEPNADNDEEVINARRKRECMMTTPPPAKRHEGKGTGATQINDQTSETIQQHKQMYEDMSQTQLMHNMFAQMMLMDKVMASKSDIKGMEERRTNRLHNEADNLKTDQQQLRSQVEERIKKFEENQKEELKKLELKVQEVTRSNSSSSGIRIQANNERNNTKDRVSMNDDDRQLRVRQVVVSGIGKGQTNDYVTNNLNIIVKGVLGDHATFETGVLG